ncbi:MAG: glycoside hydrolase domain-containing protein [Candidatus Acidiferrales bacterium]
MRGRNAALLIVFAAAWAAFCGGWISPAQARSDEIPQRPRAFLGFDSNEYPGDTSLENLKRTFSFSGYWVNDPPGAKSNEWAGKREALRAAGFGFLVLFNGRLERELNSPADPSATGIRDAQAAANAAAHEGFPPGTIIFLDQEEGGRMTAPQMSYILAWIDALAKSGYRAGIYCSGMPAREGKNQFIITANDIRARAAPRSVTFFVYDDACPPSPGCVYPQVPLSPAASGVPYASVWQFAQSPRRHSFTRHCRSTYAMDGDCYPPGAAASAASAHPLLDLDTATSPDPSQGR